MAQFWWKWGFRVVGLLVLALGFSGCAPLPAAYMVAMQAVDGVSYVATGKSPTDHLLSAVLDEDCALHRLVSDDPVCKGSKDGIVRIAGLTVEPMHGEIGGDINRQGRERDGGITGDPAPRHRVTPRGGDVVVAARPVTGRQTAELTFIPADAALTGAERWRPAHMVAPDGVHWAGTPDIQWAAAGEPGASSRDRVFAGTPDPRPGLPPRRDPVARMAGATQAQAGTGAAGASASRPPLGMIWGVPRSMMAAGDLVLPAGRSR